MSKFSSFGDKLKNGFAGFMAGRHGLDQFGRATFIAGLVCTILNLFFRSSLLSTIGLILYFYTLYRMFSRNEEKRSTENRKYLSLTNEWKTKIRQFKLRLQNSKQYKYFRCPQCKTLLRVSRSRGEINVTCGKCGYGFRQKS